MLPSVETSTEQTTDYARFRLINSNRAVSENHVLSLMRSIQDKNLLHLSPIIVNDSYEVVDGQHRLEAASRLQVPIYFVISSDVNKADIATLNTQQKNWTINDYVNYWWKEQAPGFDVLVAFTEEFPFLNVSSAIRLIGLDNSSTHLKKGKLNVSNHEKAQEIALICKWFRNHFEHAFLREFALAIKHMVNTGKYDHELMKKQVAKQPRSLVRCISWMQYVQMLQDIYNYDLSKNRTRFI